jgi:Domain of Unknown Function (DUF1206)
MMSVPDTRGGVGVWRYALCGQLGGMSTLTNAARTARRASNNPALEILTRAGLVGYGVLHLAVAWLALRIATGKPTAEGDQSGAFRVLAAQPLGAALVWGIAIGLLAMSVWQLFEAAVGHTDETGGRRVAERVASVGRTIVYAALAWTAYKVASGAPTSSAHQQQKATAGILGQPGGPFWVGLAGVLVVAVGLILVWYGVTKQFERKLRISQMRARIRRFAVATGRFGYVVKGLAYAIVGVLLVVAAAEAAPRRSTGLDGALRTLVAQPFGVLLLGIVALGFAVFGVYCFLQSRYRKV